jgi:hypothetical protein
MAILDFLAGVFEPLPRFIAGVWGTLTGHSTVGAVLWCVGAAVVVAGITWYELRKGRTGR